MNERSTDSTIIKFERNDIEMWSVNNAPLFKIPEKFSDALRLAEYALYKWYDYQLRCKELLTDEDITGVGMMKLNPEKAGG